MSMFDLIVQNPVVLIKVTLYKMCASGLTIVMVSIFKWCACNSAR